MTRFTMESPVHSENRSAVNGNTPVQPPGAENTDSAGESHLKTPESAGIAPKRPFPIEAFLLYSRENTEALFGYPGESGPTETGCAETGDYGRPNRVDRYGTGFLRPCVSALWFNSRQIAKRPIQALVAMLAIANQTPPCISSAPLLAALSGVIADHLKRGKAVASRRVSGVFATKRKGACQ